LDLGGNGNRNGVGKSSLISAVTYGLYGQALSNIKRDNLINSTNKKNLVVIVEFEKNGSSYRIERGRRPNYFKYIVDSQEVNEANTDESQGESKETQRAIDAVLGVSYSMFRHTVALNTITEPFLSMGSGKQRELIEELLGITLLSQKSDSLRDLIKLTRTEIEREEFKITTVKNSNQRILTTIQSLESKILRWDTQQAQKIQELEASYNSLSHLDVDEEIAAHKSNAALREIGVTVKNLRGQLRDRTSRLSQYQREQSALLTQYSKVQDHNCAMCDQPIHSSQQVSLLADLESKIIRLDQIVQDLSSEISTMEAEISLIEPAILGLTVKNTFHTQIEQAYDHRNSLNQLSRELERERDAVNPYLDQVGGLNSTLQELNYVELNELGSLKDHQEFLLKLLTNKDSFIRKRIIDQNLAYLNHRLAEYLTALNLPHEVRFSNDLGVEITHMGQDYDFEQLSRGERTRVILSLSWAFRDISENTNTPINFMAVDELLDSGLDAQGLEKAIEVLKKMSRDRNKNILLISHREELSSRVENVLTVLKEDGFTRFDWDYDSV
jgi:DNA repair exonuclease SbcCD ATPase subunit